MVTGGAGFIGSNFVRFLLSRESNVQVINLDALTYAGSIHNLEGLPERERHHFVEGDICDADLVSELLATFEVDTVVHFAAESHVDRSIHGPTPFIKTNIEGTFSLLECARKYWLGGSRFEAGEIRFHHVSTDEVYGSLGPNEPAWTEESPYDPNSPYAASKAASDHLVRSYGHTYGMPYTITNCSNNYGPYQHPEKLIPLMITNALREKPLPVYGDGQQVRDWLHVRDHCRAIWQVLNQEQSGTTYHISAQNQYTTIEVVERICTILDETHTRSAQVPYRDLIEFVEDRPGHDRRYAMDASKIRKELGWQASIPFAEGLRNTIDWYLENEVWVQSIRERGDYHQWIEENYQSRSEKK